MATREELKQVFANGQMATGEKFANLIDSMKVVQLPVVDPQALGTSLSFIDSISQDADGKITATKKTLDLANAHELNPFKGWYKTGDTLPTDGFDGAYLYFKDTSELTGQTTIYRWNGTAYADTGTVVDTSNVQTFGTGQAVNEVKIKDENGEDVTGTAGVLSAEAGKTFGSILFEEINIPIEGTIYEGYVDSAGIYAVATTTQKTVLLNFEDYKGLKVLFEKRDDATGNIIISYLKDDYIHENELLHFCDTMQGRQSYTESTKVTIPNDCKYLFILKAADRTDTGDGRLPNIKYDKNIVKDLDDTTVRVSDIVDDLDTNDNQKPLSASQGYKIGEILYSTITTDIPINETAQSGYIDSSGKYQDFPNRSVLKYFGDYAGKNIILKKKPNATGNIIISYLKNNTLVDNEEPAFCDDYFGRQMYSESENNVIVPNDCNYVYILAHDGGDTVRLPDISLVDEKSIDEIVEDLEDKVDSIIKNNDGIFETRFQVNVETTQPQLTDYNDVSINTKKASAIYADNCVLYLPSTYSATGNPTKLIIFCKQGGTKIGQTSATDYNRSTANSSPILQSIGSGLPVFPYLLSLGYAVLAADGEPDAWLQSLNLGDTYSDLRVAGNYVSVQSTRKAYDYVVKNYNIDTNGAFVFGYSQGGQYAQNVVDLSGIPILSVAEVCPVCSFEYHQWYIHDTAHTIGDVANCEWPARLNIARMFGFGSDIATNAQLSELVYSDYKDFTIGYDPWTRNVENMFTDFLRSGNIYNFSAGVTLDDVTMVKHSKSPLKIWCAEGDTTLGVDVMKAYIKAIKNSGNVADITVYANGGHRFFDNEQTLGTVTLPNGIAYTYGALAVDVAIWFRLFGGY